MDIIFNPDETFNFDDITLAHPTSIQGGFYFTRINVKNTPLYIETPPSFTKQGFIKNGKKVYCDLMFNNGNDAFINWLEKLENKCQDLIYKKSDDWFENGIERSDIESAFTSPIRVFKSGKNYLLRVNVKMNNVSTSPTIKIYNENEDVLIIDDVKDDTNIISILEVSGIKFTSRNFQIYIEVKQIMVLNNDKIFEKCLIKHKKTEETFNESPNREFQSESLFFEKKDPVTNIEESLEDLENIEIKIDTNPTPSNNPEDLIEITDDLNLENIEAIKLKKPNQVYYEMYKVARQKAKEAKKNAIIAFLEAKNIKKTYMLDNLDDSDSDSDIQDDSDNERNLEE
jgi:hypothetical protein